MSSSPISIASSSSSTTASPMQSYTTPTSWDRFLSPFSSGTHEADLLVDSRSPTPASSSSSSRRSSFVFEFKEPTSMSSGAQPSTASLLSRLLQQQPQPQAAFAEPTPTPLPDLSTVAMTKRQGSYDPSVDPRLLAIHH